LLVKSMRTAGTLLKYTNYNVTGNGERECLKMVYIGQSAAKPLQLKRKVHRLNVHSTLYERMI